MPFFPENASSFGVAIDQLTLLITVCTAIALGLAEAAVFYALVRWRAGRSRQARHLTGESWTQARWVLLPVLIVVIGDLFIDLKTSSVWNEVKGRIPSPDVTVRIRGMQFAFLFSYPGPDGRLRTADDFTVPNELHVAVDQNVKFELEASDVLHSLWIPSLRLKQDAVPGRVIAGWFRATRTGEYEVACAEICGPGHTMMHARLVVHSAEEFDRWLAGKGKIATTPLHSAPVELTMGRSDHPHPRPAQ
ncbi:MAG: cytochrome c oxidase subunit II [Gemmatimonadales bacterium]|nr:cytochrome c oxidase subunit II [Gemmatimonadales bacterium]